MSRNPIYGKYLIFIFLGFTICIQNSFAEKSKRSKKISQSEIICDSLPQAIHESSGLIYFDNLLWTINDSGDGPYIYAMDTLGKKMIRKITVENAQNIDWEEISQDKHFIYIGDFGNNYGQRDQLTIYKIKKKDIIAEDNVKAVKIEFSYKDKPKAVKHSRLHHSEYDCEAMVCEEDTIILFSKNWKEPYCFIYKLPAEPGNYSISPFEKVYLNGLITGATLSPDKSKIVLVGYRDYMPFLYVIKKFDLHELTFEKKHSKDFPLLTGYQTEGVTFISNNTILVSSEYNPYRSGILLKFNIQ